MLGMFPVAEEPGITNNPLVFTVWVLHAKDFVALHADDSFPFICSDLSDKWFRSRWFTESWSDAAFTSIFFLAFLELLFSVISVSWSSIYMVRCQSRKLAPSGQSRSHVIQLASAVFRLSYRPRKCE